MTASTDSFKYNLVFGVCTFYHKLYFNVIRFHVQTTSYKFVEIGPRMMVVFVVMNNTPYTECSALSEI